MKTKERRFELKNVYSFKKGHIEHEILGFFKYLPSEKRNGKKRFEAIFYDCNTGSNLLEIGREFLKGLDCHVRGIYSNAIHGLQNDDEGICGELTFFELFLYFIHCDNPFYPKLELRPLLGNSNVGHHGPHIYGPQYDIPIERNRNVPRNQLNLELNG